MTVTNAPLPVGPCPCLPHTSPCPSFFDLEESFLEAKWGTDKYEDYKLCFTGCELGKGKRFPWLLRKCSAWYTGNVGISQSAPAKICLYSVYLAELAKRKNGFH